jgi:molybdopterin-containing oxidoreductase family iron-sulfur binding subunit
MLSATAVAFGLDAPARDLSPEQTRWVRRAVRGLKAAGEGLVLVGAHLPVEMHELAILLNERIGAVGRTLVATDPIRKEPAEDFHLASLVRDMAGGGVSELVTLGVNPAYAAPAALGFADACRKVDFHLHAGLHMDETAALAHWHAPLQHDLESWSDGLAADGTAGIIQPLVRPFRSVRSAHVLLDRLMGGGATERDIVRATWRRRWQGEDFEGRWADALYRGHVSGSRPASLVPEVTGPRSAPASREPPSALMLAVRPDPSVWDGSQADNAWLQETPKPISKIAWGNALLVAPKLAAAHGIADGDEIAVAADGREIAGPAVLAEGQDEGTVTAFLGHGRRRSELAAGIGYDIYALLPAAGGLDMPLSSLRRTGARSMVATTQPSKRMDGFDFVRQVAHPQDQAAPARTEPSFYPVPKTQSTQWGMSIDLDLCIGCNACVVACTAENNVPVVGKDLVAQGREMHWLRVDHYIEGTKDGLRSHFQPVPCMHCEQAPCEMGCPVNATVHSSDGLNLQVYNRCIGTRTCSSYCPYKVRRFNWFDFTGTDPESVRAMRNPDVTVRSRGVMEKCTYCVQRIEEARIVAKKDGRPIRDGEVVTACQQACPTQAIVFGDIADPQSAVSRSKAGPRDYTLLEEANTRPRTTYLARIMEPGDEEQG